MKLPLYTEDLIKSLPKIFPRKDLLKGNKPNFETRIEEIWFEQGKQYVLQRLTEAHQIQDKEANEKDL